MTNLKKFAILSGLACTAVQFICDNSVVDEHSLFHSSACSLRINLTGLASELETEVANLVSKVGGIEAPKDAPDLFVIDDKESGGYHEIHVVRDTTGLIVSARLSKVYCGYKGRVSRVDEIGSVVFWRSSGDGKVAVGFSNGRNGSAYSAAEFAMRHASSARRFLDFARMLQYREWTTVPKTSNFTLKFEGEER